MVEIYFNGTFTVLQDAGMFKGIQTDVKKKREGHVAKKTIAGKVQDPETYIPHTAWVQTLEKKTTKTPKKQRNCFSA